MVYVNCTAPTINNHFFFEEEEEVVVWYQGYYYTMCITICIDLRIIEGAKYRTSKAFKNYFIKKQKNSTKTNLLIHQDGL